MNDLCARGCWLRWKFAASFKNHLWKKTDKEFLDSSHFADCAELFEIDLFIFLIFSLSLRLLKQSSSNIAMLKMYMYKLKHLSVCGWQNMEKAKTVCSTSTTLINGNVRAYVKTLDYNVSALIFRSPCYTTPKIFK